VSVFPVLRAAARRALASTATTTAFCAAGLGSVALAATPAAALHPRHGSSHASHASHAAHASHGTKHHEAGTKAARRTRAAKHGHADRHAERRAGRRHHGRRYETVDVAEETPAPVVIPQFALPDLAVSAATYPAGRTLAGFGGPVETAMIPASAAARTITALTHSASSLLDALVTRARSQLGTRYVFGGAEPGAGLDCSSFANQQAQIGRAIPRDASLLRPGDLLTFGSRSHVSHVGIYLGEGRFIHASVKHGAIIETTIDRNRSLFRRWQGARRLFAAAGDSTADRGAAGG